MADLYALYDFLSRSGWPGALLLFLVGLHLGWVVLGAQYREMKEQRDFYRSIAWGNNRLAETALDLNEKRRLP